MKKNLSNTRHPCPVRQEEKKILTLLSDPKRTITLHEKKKKGKEGALSIKQTGRSIVGSDGFRQFSKPDERD